MAGDKRMLRVSMTASVCVTLALGTSPIGAQQQPPPGQPGQPGQPAPPGQWPPQQPGQWQQQPGQWQQQPGQWQQQPGQWPQQPGQWQQQPGQWQQQPGQWQQQPGQWQQQPPPRKEEPRQFESSFGLKLLAGANLWTSPDDIEPAYDALGFAGSAGGFGYGIALYYEARIAQYLGLELDFGYDHSTLQRDLSYKINGVAFDMNEEVTASGLRWGLLVKAVIPVVFGRVWFGIGPEFVSGSTVDGKVEITSGSPTPAQRKELEDSISVTSKRSTMLTMAFGVSIDLGENFEIPIDLRVAKNLSQDAGWRDRVDTTKLFASPTKYDVTVQSSWDFRLGTGLGYRF